jgi:hypothetical protein
MNTSWVNIQVELIFIINKMLCFIVIEGHFLRIRLPIDRLH